MMHYFERFMEKKRMEDFEAEAYGCIQCEVTIQKMGEHDIEKIRSGLKLNGQQTHKAPNGNIARSGSTLPFNPFARTKSLPFGLCARRAI